MSTPFAPIELLVWGDFACFTRPEHKVERVSYPVPTPTAARGIFEAIFWKPQFTWRVEQIRVLKPIRFFSIQRNEVTVRQSPYTAATWINDDRGYFTSEDRTQRHTLALRDVAYVFTAQVNAHSGLSEDVAKYRDQFRRRMRRGRCFHQPYLGCREFAAGFAPPQGDESAIDHTEDFGSMLLDLVYQDDRSGAAEPRFFQARLERGILRVPSPEEADHAPSAAG